MDDREVLDRFRWNGDLRDPFRGRRKCREKGERKMAHSILKLRTMGPIPGIDRIERFKLRNARPFHHTHQIQTSIGDSSRAVGETDQGKHRARRPDFGIGGARGFERGKRKDNVADRAGAN
jgi:hypothetical protein